MDDWLYTTGLVLATMMILACATGLVAAAGWTAAAYGARMRRERELPANRHGRSRITVEAGSPLRVSEFGEKICERTGARQWARETAPQLRERLNDLRPFRIDEFSREYVDNELDHATQERVAECAYELGTERHGVRAVLAVLLRDELLRLTGQKVPDGKDKSGNGVE